LKKRKIKGSRKRTKEKQTENFLLAYKNFSIDNLITTIPSLESKILDTIVKEKI
jgi:hypothetical protein